MVSIDFDRVSRFLTQAALPFWSTTAFYDNGCFVEHLDLAGSPVDPGFTRVRVQARQIYVFSHAEYSGLFPAREICAKAADFFIGSAWLGPDKGWARMLDRHGAVIDESYDFYDVSFALFAIGWYYRVSEDPRCLSIAHATLDFLERHAVHPQGGYRNDDFSAGPRQQNPHMHLLEALNVWFEATGDMRFADMAETIIQLFETRFTDPESGALFEFFNDDWSRMDGPEGQIVEPGHQFEWAWIIGHNGRMTGRHRPELMRRLINSAMRGGYNAYTGLTVDQVDGQGQLIAGSHRLWPQTEAIKAALAEFEFLGIDTSERTGKILAATFKYFLEPAPVPGTWIDHYSPEWTPIVTKIPASSLYHVALAFQEILRLREGLGRD